MGLHFFAAVPVGLTRLTEGSLWCGTHRHANQRQGCTRYVIFSRASGPEIAYEFGYPYMLINHTTASLMYKIYLNQESKNFPKILEPPQNYAQPLSATVHSTPDLNNKQTEVIAAVLFRIQLLCDVALRPWVRVSRRFGGTYCLRLQGLRCNSSYTREDKATTFLRNVAKP
jgi:hypothetical protein